MGSMRHHIVREKYFNNNVVMMLVVVDMRRENFTIYQRGIDEVREFTLSSIKTNSSKPNGVDLDAVFKAYQMGSATNL
jgi:uncharacterized membrane protein